MEFTARHPDGRTERRRFVAYSVKQTGPSEWTARRTRDGSLLGRSYRSEASLRQSCDCITEPAPR